MPQTRVRPYWRPVRKPALAIERGLLQRRTAPSGGRMNGGILAAAGGLATLLAIVCLPMVTIDEAQTAVFGLHLATGLAAALLGLASTALGVVVWRTQRAPLGWAIAAAALGQAAAMAATWSHVWALVPCTRLDLGSCDVATGGLLEGSLVTLDIGMAAVVAGAVVTLFGALAILVAPRQFRRDERFLRVLLSWGGQVVAERVLFRPVRVTIGESDADTFQLPVSGLRGHVLLAPQRDGQYVLDVPTGASGLVTVGGRERQAADIAMARVQPGDTGRLGFENDVEIAFTFTGAETATLPAGLLAGGDRGVLVSFCAVAAAMLLFFTGVVTQIREHRRVVEEDAAKKGVALIELNLVDPAEPPVEEPLPTVEKTSDGNAKPSDEGKRGEPDRSHDKADHRPGKQVPAPKGNTQDPTRTGLVQVLQDARGKQSALGEILAGGEGRPESLLTDPSGDGSADVQVGGGPKGLGFKGTGTGGPNGTGSDFSGHGPGPLVEGPLGRKRVSIGNKDHRKTTDWIHTQPTPSAGCDKGDIAKTVRSRASSIRSCYEVQLMSRADLGGKITVQWSISGDGSVTQARATDDTMQSPAVTDCVLRAMRHLRFKAPEPGSTCVVSWPFAFSPGGR